MISSFCLQPSFAPLIIIGFAIAAVSAMGIGWLVLGLRPFQSVNSAIRTTLAKSSTGIAIGTAPSPIAAPLIRHIIQQLQQFLDMGSKTKRDEVIRKQAEIEIEALEIQLGTVLNASSSTIAQSHVFLDGSWKCVYFSPNCQKLLGFTAEEFIADSDLWMSRILPEDQEKVVMPIFQDILAGRVATMEFRFQHQDGSIYWISDTVTPLWNEAANCWVVTCVETNITFHKQAEAALQENQERVQRDRQQAENALRHSEQRFRAVFDQIEIGMNLTQLSGNYLQVNPAFCNLVGYSDAELLAMSYRDLTYPDDQEIEVSLAAQMQTGDLQTYSLEKRYVRKDGQLCWVNVHVSSVLDSQGDILFATAIVQDIGDRKRTEAALRWSEARNCATISAIPDLLICMDAMGNYLEVVEGQNVRLLKPEDGFENKNIFDVLPTDLAKQRMGYVQQALQTGQVQVYEHQIEVEGDLYDEEIRVAMIGENEVLIMVRDISDRKRIENERRRNEGDREKAQHLLRRQAEREYALNQMTQAIRHSLDLETIFLTATREIGNLLQVDQVGIAKYLPEPGEWHHVAEYLRDSSLPSALDIRIVDRNNPIAAQLKQNQTVRIDNANHLIDCINQELAQQFSGAWLLIPLEVEGKVWGCLTLLRADIQTYWQNEDVDLVSAVADQLAIAIQQSQLYQRVQQLNIHLEQEVQQRTAQLRQALSFEALLKRITDKVRDSLDEDQILQTAVDELGQGLQVKCCNAALYDLTLTSHTITHEYSLAQPFALGQQIAFADCPAIEIFDQLIQNICLQFCFTVTTYAQPHGEIYAILACPMMDDQGILGDLWLYRSKHDTFDELEIRLVQQVANQCAIALRQSRLYQAAQLQVQELERLNGLKDDFLSTVSHELRTPMANIKMATQMLEISMEQQHLVYADGNDTLACINTGDRIERYLQILKEECHRETSLINDLLDLSRLDSGSEPLLPLTHHLQYWLPHITESFVERTHSQQQQFSITIDDALPPLTTDFNYLEMILTELLHNACKYTPLGEAIAVSATFDPTIPGIILAIANSGVEIPAAELQHVFDKFYRVPNNDPWKHGGTGLGLALVKKRVERLNGAIAVSSQNGWTTFTIKLPLQSQ
ncbi:PAS domain S-box protein [Leptolyngbyaceae cyanobacterium UHCC 1019]